MRIRLAKLFPLLCFCLTTMTAFGQSTRIWTGGNGTGTDIGQSTNWDNGLPPTIDGSTGEWNGTVPGNLSLFYNTLTLTSGFGQSGVNLYLNFAQTGSVSIVTSLTTTPILAIYNVTIESGAGAFTVGGTDNQHLLNWIGRPAGAIHSLINDSTNVATLTPWIRYTSGGGATWMMDFGGKGNWQCNSYLNDDGGASKLIAVEGPGTVTWNPVGLLGSTGLATPLSINGGTLILQGSHPRLNNQAIVMNGNFIFAPTNPTTAQTLSGVISGGGGLTVANGTLTLASLNTYTGDTIVSGGKLIIQGVKTGAGNITVADGAALRVFVTGTQITPGTLTLGTSGSVTLEFNNLGSATTEPLAAGALSAPGMVAVNIDSGTFTEGQSYPLLSWSSGNAPAVNPGNVNGAVGFLSTNGNSIQFNVTTTFFVAPPTLNLMNNGNSLRIFWTDAFNNFRLQSRTTLLGTNWTDYPGGFTNPVIVPIDPVKATMFLRLVSP